MSDDMETPLHFSLDVADTMIRARAHIDDGGAILYHNASGYDAETDEDGFVISVVAALMSHEVKCGRDVDEMLARAHEHFEYCQETGKTDPCDCDVCSAKPGE